MNDFSKSALLDYFRIRADEFSATITAKYQDHKKRADLINKQIKVLSENVLKELNKKALREQWSRTKLLENVLLINYVTYVVMLEYRNKMWGYDYMAFARRVGELWEPFCKLPFKYPIRDIEIYEPPTFDSVREDLQNQISEFIENLQIKQEEKEKLLEYFSTVWGLVESGGIKLELDLHFKLGDIFYNVDYKSGFSSNEKGNTNRLLLVASIYHSLPENHKTLIFVRQREEENNHYLQTLKNSNYWDVYCADEAYEKIKEFTGFDLREWMNRNMDWQNDISNEFREYLSRNNILKYLTW